MIEFRLLGSLALTGPDGREPGAVLQQPKRLALLAYLAVASPRGFHRRDTLLALFWPERDAEHARAALSHGLYTLRRALGDGVIVSRGDEEVGLAREHCWCDAVAFEDAVDGGRLDEGIGLYRGELLAGFHLAGTPEFERWLEETRARLRDRATRTAWTLAEEEAARERLPLAVRWARCAVALSPYHEPGVRRLVGLLERAGDRAEAVYEYEQFARRLSADLELEPSAETLALVEAVRTRRWAGSSQDRTAPRGPWRPTSPASGSGSEESRASASEQPSPRGTSAPVAAAPRSPARSALGRRRLARLILSLFVLGAIGVAGTIVPHLRSPPALRDSSTTIAVLPFSYRGRPEFNYLTEGMAELLSSRFEGAVGIRSIDPHALLAFTSRDGTSDPRRGRLAAERLGAGLFVLGSTVEAGGRLQISATLFDAQARPRSSAQAIAGSEAEIFEVADRLARHFLAEAQDAPLETARVAGQTTLSLPALKAYLEGERELRLGRVSTAHDAFRLATELDTSFALAFYRLASVADSPEARGALDRALRNGERLPEHHRWLVEAAAALLRGDHTMAEQRIRQALTVRPDFAEAWSSLGNLTLRRGYLIGLAWVDAREAFERALALDPQDAYTLWRLTAIAAREGRRADLESLTVRLLQLKPAHWLASNVRGQLAVALGDTVEEARFVADLRTRPDPWAQSSAGYVTWTTGDLSAGRRLWSVVTDPSRSPGMRVLAHVTLAKIELTNGRWRAANAELKAVEALDRGSAFEHQALFALTRFLETPRSQLVALRDSLRRWDAGTRGSDGDGLLAMHRQVHPYLRLYLLGLLSARLGEEAAALRYAADLERGDRSSSIGAFAADQGQVVRAEVAWIRGRPREALATLEQARFWTTQSGLDVTGDSPFYTHMYERFARAELLHELGREEEALAWYRSFTYDLLYTGPAHLRMAQIYERRGERRQALEHYSRFIELWRECDPALQPVVQQARVALVRFR